MRTSLYQAIALIVASALVLSSGNAHAALVRHWTLNDGDIDPNTTTAIDSTGNANGTLLNFDTPPAWTSGLIGGALDFDGLNDSVAAGSNALGTSSFTVTAWFKADAFRTTGDVNHILLSQYTDQPGRAYLGVRTVSGAARLVMFLNPINFQLGASTITTDEWHFAAVTRSGNSFKLYLDGAQDGSFSSAQALPNTGNFIGGYGSTATIGTGFPPASFFNGLIDDVRVYDNALNAGEIESLYLSGIPEPSAMALAGVGLAVCAVVRRRRGACG